MRGVHGCAVVVASALLLAAQAGCGPSLPKTYPVRGKVVFKNGKPFSGGAVTFQSTADEKVLSDGPISPDGTFALTTKMHGLEKQGAAEGEHHVLVENPAWNVGPDGQYRYRPLVVSKTYHVAAGDNEFTIEVESPK